MDKLVFKVRNLIYVAIVFFGIWLGLGALTGYTFVFALTDILGQGFIPYSNEIALQYYLLAFTVSLIIGAVFGIVTFFAGLLISGRNGHNGYNGNGTNDDYDFLGDEVVLTKIFLILASLFLYFIVFIVVTPAVMGTLFFIYSFFFGVPLGSWTPEMTQVLLLQSLFYDWWISLIITAVLIILIYFSRTRDIERTKTKQAQTL